MLKGDRAKAEECETYWINYYNDLGANLLNSHIGTGPIADKAIVDSLGWRNWPHSGRAILGGEPD